MSAPTTSNLSAAGDWQESLVPFAMELPLHQAQALEKLKEKSQ